MLLIKTLLKSNDELDEEKLRYNYHFKTYLTQAQLVEKLLSFDEVLSDAYDFIQELRKAYKKKDYEVFMTCIKKYQGNYLMNLRRSLKYSNVLKMEFIQLLRQDIPMEILKERII